MIEILTIEYSPNGISISDFNVVEFARTFCKNHNEFNEDAIYVVSSEIFIDAMKLMIVEGLISHEDIVFVYNNEKLKVNYLGEIERYPSGFCDAGQKILSNVIKERINKRRRNKGSIES
ncbi:hypothetical protein BSK59_16175 [Paenibacillus odorifer]|uniref:hypothetical protein n=1 Tax=Paenibacillus odorifer TaxID=189426 RepID=UPI00096ECE2E|nr:hypothetical protein [Paenibacillus odorifer]OME54116.1 hypothetical protein BSK59_16175 [Paenibacillus odorifer]